MRSSKVSAEELLPSRMSQQHVLWRHPLLPWLLALVRVVLYFASVLIYLLVTTFDERAALRSENPNRIERSSGLYAAQLAFAVLALLDTLGRAFFTRWSWVSRESLFSLGNLLVFCCAVIPANSQYVPSFIQCWMLKQAIDDVSSSCNWRLCVP